MIERRTRPKDVFAYSFDRETFRGRFDTRQSALEAARGALPVWPGPVEAIYVGRRIEPQIDVGETGAAVLDALRERAMDEHTPPIDLDGLTADARRDLDDLLAQALRRWIERHRLTPEPRVEEIGEFPLPRPSDAPAPARQPGREVSILGYDG